MPTIVKEYRLVMVEIENNHSKAWVGKLFDNGDVRTEWGRVGDGMQSKDFPGAGEKFLESKKREKEKKGYKAIQSVASNVNVKTASGVKNKDLEDVAIRDIAPKCDTTKKLIKHLVSENRHQIAAMSGGKVQVNTSGLVTTATGDVIASSAVEDAKELLNKMNPMISKGNFGSDRFKNYIQDYLMLVPQQVGRDRGWHEDFFNSSNTVQKQMDFLESLSQSIDLYKKLSASPSATDTSKVDRVFKFGLSILDDDKEFKRIEKLHIDSRQKVHTCFNMKVKNIWKVEHSDFKKRFVDYSSKLANHMELFHGSHKGNLISIMNSFLKTSPPNTAAIAGKNFGCGCYFASCSTKSLNYATGYWTGNRSNDAFLFLADVAMGNIQVPDHTTSKNPDKGYDSYWAKTGKTSHIINDEMIIFNEAQHYLKYLIEFE